MARKLTKKIVEEITCEGGEPVFVWDSELKGFGVRVTASGIRSYILQYRVDRRERRMTLGRHGSITLDQARKLAIIELGRINQGVDPLQVKQDRRDALTVGKFFEVYMDRHARSHKKPRSIEDDLYLFNKEIKKAFGARLITTLTRGDVVAWHQGMSGRPTTANRALSLLSKMLSCAEEWGFIQAHPARRVRKFKEKARCRYLSPAEQLRLAKALRDVDEKGFVTIVDEDEKDEEKAKRCQVISPAAIAAIRLLILTGMRKSEVLMLTWEEVDLGNSCLRLIDSKSGDKVVWLNSAAVDLLRSIRRKNDFVFPSSVKAGFPLVNIYKPWGFILKAAGIDGLRIHDLRHSFASAGAGLGLSLPLIGALLGHSQAQTTQRYAHLVDEPQRKAAEAIGDAIAAAMSGKIIEVQAKEAPEKKKAEN